MKLEDFERDDDGYLVDRDNWTPEFARLAAEEAGLTYDEAVEVVVYWARDYTSDHQGKAPDNSIFNKAFDRWEDVGMEKPKKISERKKFITKVVTNGPGMKQITKIAGLPKPKGCV